MPTINRNNYETFFLLYVDGELSAAEKQAVEQFAHEHPDLGIELEMLRQTLLLPGEQLLFANKETLFRESPVVSHNNYETYLLSYIDNELNATEQATVEGFVQQNATAQETLALLKQAKLEAEPIVCPDKKSLYRTAAKERPVVYLRRWQRIAAAAVIAGLSLTVWVVFSPEKNVAKDNLAAGKNSTRQMPAITNTGTPATIPADQNQQVGQSSLPVTVASEATRNNTIHANNQVVDQSPLTQGQGQPATSSPIAYAAIAKAETVTSVERAEDIHSIEMPVIASIPANATIAIQNNTAGLNNQSIAATDQSKHIVYKELETNEDNKGLLLGSIEINKDKLRGFFRKASSIFKSKAAKEEDDGRGLK